MPVWREEMAKKKVGAYITLDGEKEFRSAVTQCNKSLSTMKSEMKLVEAETAGNANSVDTLRKKNEVLTRTLDKQVEKEEAVRKGFDTCTGRLCTCWNRTSGVPHKAGTGTKHTG